MPRAVLTLLCPPGCPPSDNHVRGMQSHPLAANAPRLTDFACGFPLPIRSFLQLNNTMRCRSMSRALLALAIVALAASAVAVRAWGVEGRPHRCAGPKGDWGEQVLHTASPILMRPSVACLSTCRWMPPAPTEARPPRQGGQLGSAWERRCRQRAAALK